MNQEKKAIIRDALKKVIPKSWKWSLKVDNYSSIILTIQSAPYDLIQEVMNTEEKTNWGRATGYSDSYPKPTYVQINPYYLSNQFEFHLPVFEAIVVALKSAGYYNNSDAMTDYFDTAYYYNIHIGKWNKPFEVKA